MLPPRAKATATPPKEAWARPSPMKAMPRTTTNEPTTAHTRLTISSATRARTMNGEAQGSSSRSLMDGNGPSFDVQHQEVALEGGVKNVLGEDGPGLAEGDDLSVQADGMVEAAGHAREVVSGDQEGLALSAQVVEEVEEVVLAGGVHAGEGLVEKEDAGLLGQRTGDEHPPLLAAGQLADLAAGQVDQAHLLQALLGDLAVVSAGAAQRAPAGRAGPQH